MAASMFMRAGSQTEPDNRNRLPAHFVLMDRVYRHQRHFYDLTRRHYLAGRIRLIRGINAVPGQQILEIGCGTAWNLIKIAERYPGTQLTGIDASTEMLRSATRAIRRANLSNRISLSHGLAEQVPGLFTAHPNFDHVIFSYSLSMIEDWNRAIFAATQISRQRGQLHIVDFGDLGNLSPTTASLLRAWLHLFHVNPRVELLRRVEQMALDRPDCSLHILTGRYAFVFRASIAEICDLRG
jgi:S-adenosylmethionine-diacylgycerolhomoserine-N-methlytransferase